MDYDFWDAVYETFEALLASTSCPEWDAPTVHLVLYAIARDNEMGDLAEMVAEDPNNVLCLAERAVDSNERDAKWQLADQLGRLKPPSPHAEQAEALLLRYMRDADEFVRRRALRALSYLGSPHVLELVGPAWERGDEYQRIGVLCALHQIGSPLLTEYAARAEAEGQQKGLLKYATYVREHGTLSGFAIQGCPVVDLY